MKGYHSDICQLVDFQCTSGIHEKLQLIHYLPKDPCLPHGLSNWIGFYNIRGH